MFIVKSWRGPTHWFKKLRGPRDCCTSYAMTPAVPDVIDAARKDDESLLIPTGRPPLRPVCCTHIADVGAVASWLTANYDGRYVSEMLPSALMPMHLVCADLTMPLREEAAQLELRMAGCERDAIVVGWTM